MEAQFRVKLPAVAWPLLDRVEEAIGGEVRVSMEGEEPSPTDPNPDRMACSVSVEEATIWIRSLSKFDAQGAVHELLHLERYLVQRVPQVLPIPTDPEHLKITSEIENSIEHLVIVPREADYGFEPYAYWNTTAAKNWGRHPWPEITNPWARRKVCLLGFLGVNHIVTDRDVRQHAEAILRLEGLLDEAVKFAEKVQSLAVGNKAAALSTTIRFLKIPPSEVELVVYDLRSKREILSPLPKH